MNLYLVLEIFNGLFVFWLLLIMTNLCLCVVFGPLLVLGVQGFYYGFGHKKPEKYV